MTFSIGQLSSTARGMLHEMGIRVWRLRGAPERCCWVTPLSFADDTRAVVLTEVIEDTVGNALLGNYLRALGAGEVEAVTNVVDDLSAFASSYHAIIVLGSAATVQLKMDTITTVGGVPCLQLQGVAAMQSSPRYKQRAWQLTRECLQRC